MNKFKIGDKVKKISQGEHGRTALIGSIGTVGYITDSNNPFMCVNLEDGRYVGCQECSDWILYEEPKKDEYKISLGTKVRVTKCVRSLPSHVGCEGVVKTTCNADGLGINNHICVKSETGGHVCCAEEVEILTDTPEKKEPQIGDKFRVIKAYGNFKVGDIVAFSREDSSDDTKWFIYGGNEEIMHYQDDMPDEVEPYEESATPLSSNRLGFAELMSQYKLTPYWTSSPLNYFRTFWDDTGTKQPTKESEVKINTMAVEIGEKYVPKKGASCGNYQAPGIRPAYLIITDIDGSYLRYEIYNEAGKKVSYCSSCFKSEDLEPYTGHKKGIMKTLSIMAQKLVDADVKAFVEAGILDSELSLTPEGQSFVLTQVLQDNKTKYAVEARKLIAERKKEDK